MFSLPLQRKFISLLRCVMVSILSNLINRSATLAGKLLALILSGIESLIVIGIMCFMTIKHILLDLFHFSSSTELLSLMKGSSQVLKAQSRSINLRMMVTWSYHFSKLVPFSTRMPLRLVEIEDVLTNKQKKKQDYIRYNFSSINFNKYCI